MTAAMADLAFILVLGAAASILVLTIAPLWLDYVAAFLTLTPILGIALWRTGIVLLDAVIGAIGAVRLGARARDARDIGTAVTSPAAAACSSEVPRALPAGESEPDYGLSAVELIAEPSAAAAVPEEVAEPALDSPPAVREIESRQAAQEA